MRTFAIALMAGVGALSLASGATASDIYAETGVTNPDLVQQVRLVCDDTGRCWRSRRGVVVRESDGYAPRERYIERRYYGDRYDYDRPRAGVGFSAPGVSVGVGVDRY